MKIFSSNYQELGSLDQNLILNTQGKIKIRYGKKFVDLIDENGNINVPNLEERISRLEKLLNKQ